MIAEKELQPLKQIAKKERAAVITFIAPERLIRINPASSGTISISTGDAYSLEKVVDSSCKGIDRAFMLLHSPGGSLTSSYNIARFLRKRFKFLHFFVPYEAASGATLMSLAGDKITLGDLGYLTPIDPQVFYKGEWVSSYGIIEKVDNLEERFKNMRPEEMPIPWRQIADKVDLIHYREMETSVFEAQVYAQKLLESAKYEQGAATIIAKRLARNYYSHGHCYDREACKEIGLKIDSTEVSMGYLSDMKALIHSLNKTQGESDFTHYIQAVIPDIELGGSQSEDIKTQNTVTNISRIPARSNGAKVTRIQKK